MAKVRRFRFGGLLMVVAAMTGLAVFPLSAGAASSDVAAAEAGTIQQADVPADFTESAPMTSQAGAPPDTSTANDGLDQQVKDIPECKGFLKVFQPTNKTVTASADGASYDKAADLGGSTLASSTLIFKSSGDAKKFFVPIKSSKLATCLDKAMKASIEESMTSGSDASTFGKFDSSIEKVQVPKTGDESAAYLIKFDIGSAPDSSFQLSMQMYFGMEFVRTGRGIGAYMSMSTGTPDDAAAQSAIKSAVGRMKVALG